MISADPPCSPRSLLRRREYRCWLLGDVLLAATAGLGSFAFPLVALTVTGSASAVGLIGLLQGLAGLLGMIPGGLITDRRDRRRLRMLSGLVGAALQLVLLTVLVTGWASLPVLAVLAVITRLCGALLGPASDAMLRQIVPTEQIPQAIAVNQGRDAAIEIGAGPLAGMLLAVNLALPAAAQMIGGLAMGLTTILLRDDYRPRSADAPPTRMWADLKEAWTWMTSQAIRIQIGAIAALVNLGSNGLLLTVTLHLALDGVPAVHIGLLGSVLGVSILLGAFLAPRLVVVVPTGILVISQIIILAISGIVLSATPSLLVIGAVYALIGLGLPPMQAATMGFFLHITPTAMQGRAQALTGLLAMLAMPLGPMISGWGLEHWGRMPTMSIFAGICLLAAIAAAIGPHLRRVPTSSGWEDHARAEGLVEPSPPTDGA